MNLSVDKELFSEEQSSKENTWIIIYFLIPHDFK
jgi:hypothetical protein